MSGADLGRLDHLIALAETLGAAWGGRADASTTIGRERAILRLIGVGGVDRRGRPLASEVVEGFLGAGSGRLGGGILLPFAMALLEYDLGPQELALDVADGTIDFGIEAQLLRDPDRRAAAERQAQSLVDAALERIDANRTARRELTDLLGEPPRPWFGLTVLEPTLADASVEVRRLVSSGVDLLRIMVPVNRELAIAGGDAATAPAPSRLMPESVLRASEAGQRGPGTRSDCSHSASLPSGPGSPCSTWVRMCRQRPGRPLWIGRARTSSSSACRRPPTEKARSPFSRPSRDDRRPRPCCWEGPAQRPSPIGPACRCCPGGLDPAAVILATLASPRGAGRRRRSPRVSAV